jgi:hypothetical protein
MPLSLPTNPTGEQFEDLLSASLRANGYYTESRVTLRESMQDVLEIDVLASPVGGAPGTERLFEAKKNPDILSSVFKLYGQRMYLNLPSACLVSGRPIPRRHADVLNRTASQMSIGLCHHGLGAGDLDTAAPVHSGLDATERQHVTEAGWFANIARRVAQDAFARMTAARRADAPYSAARDYYVEVQNTVFVREPLARVERLYDAYRSAPNMTGAFVECIASEEGKPATVIWNEIDNTADRLWLQYAEALEHCARLAIMKNALQHIVASGTGTVDTTTISFGGGSIAVPRYFLPERFVGTLAALHAWPWGSRVPYCLQLFIEGLGGMLSLTDGRDAEFLAKASGIPVAEIPRALRFYDEMFGRDGWSWFFDTRDELRRLQLVPAFMRAMGAFQRQVLGLKDYSEQFPQMGWLLSRWHNAGYAVLQPVLEVPPARSAPAQTP